VFTKPASGSHKIKPLKYFIANLLEHKNTINGDGSLREWNVRKIPREIKDPSTPQKVNRTGILAKYSPWPER